MAHDMVFNALIKPEVDNRAFNQAITKLETGLRKVKSGRHSREESLAANLIATMMKSGMATTESQARILLSRRMGGKFTSQADAIMRAAENRVRYSRQHGFLDQPELPTFTEKQLSRMRPSGASVYRRFKGLETSYAEFKENPTQQGASELGSSIKALQSAAIKIEQEYKTTSKKIPDYLAAILKILGAMEKDVSGFGGEGEGEGKSAGGIGGIGKFLGKLTGFGSLIGVLKKGLDAFQKSLGRGNQGLYWQAAYGNSANWRDVRARAGIFNMSTESAMSTSNYAADFKQRMLWGEVSEKEIIGLSRAGKWGRMVMSGEAARNPAAANTAFEQMIAGTDPAKMRSILRQLGLSQELMNYRLQPYSQSQYKEYYEKFSEMADVELEAAQMMYDAANQYQVATEQISTGIAAFVSTFTEVLSPQSREVAKRLQGRLGEMRGIADINEMVKKSANPMTQIAMQPVDWSGKGVKIGQVTNNITVQGNADSNTVREMEDLVSKEASISNWFYGTAIQ